MARIRFEIIASGNRQNDEDGNPTAPVPSKAVGINSKPTWDEERADYAVSRRICRQRKKTTGVVDVSRSLQTVSFRPFDRR